MPFIFFLGGGRLNEGPFYAFDVKKNHNSNKNTTQKLGGYDYGYRTETRNYHGGEK